MSQLAKVSNDANDYIFKIVADLSGPEALEKVSNNTITRGEAIGFKVRFTGQVIEGYKKVKEGSNNSNEALIMYLDTVKPILEAIADFDTRELRSS